MNSSIQVILISYLLFHSLNAMETSDETELHNAALHGYVNTVARLLNDGADPNVQTKLGKTPAHKSIYAESAQSISILRLLKQAGADLNKQDKNGSTPLHLAISNEKWLVADELERLICCNGKIQDKNGHTPSDLKIIIRSSHLAQQYLKDPKSLTQEYLAQFKNKKRVTFSNQKPM